MRATVFVFADGGVEVGLGHLSRCLSLVQELENRGESVRLFYPSSESVEDFLRPHHIEGEEITFSNEEILKKLTGRETVVIDSYRFTSEELEKIHKRAGCLICFDDVADREYSVDMVINGNPGAFVLDYQVLESTRLLLGAKYQILRPEFQQTFDRGYEKSPKSILVLSGGSPTSEQLEQLFDFFESFLSRYSRFNANFVIGPFINTNNFEKKKNCRIINNPNNLVKLMRTADIAVSAGGQTLYELSRCGVPTVAYCLGDDQQLNLEVLEEKGAIKYIGWLGQNGWEKKLEQALERLLNNSEKRSELGRRARKLIDGRGAGRVAAEILQECGITHEI